MAVPGRQTGVRGGRPITHKVKVTAEHEARLQREAAAQGVSVSRLLVEPAFGRGGVDADAAMGACA